MKLKLINLQLYPFLAISFIYFWSCSSYEKFKFISEEQEIPTQIFNASYHQTWQALLQVMQKFELGHKNQESGVIITQWIDNTTELNFADAFGNSDSVKSAKFKIIINAVKGIRSTREITKITIYKRQLVEQDFLQGWKEIPSDTIQEKTLLYRIRRLIEVDNKLKELEKKKEAEQLKNF
jgi:hypothetical protein